MSFNLSFSGIGTENDEEDDFASLSSNSNLASIFNQDINASQLNKKSLVYTAPKQPTRPSNAQHSQAVITATAVACYKLANEKYEPILGKMGLALLAENEGKTFRIVLYQNKQKPLATAKITSNFVLSSQPDNFCTFYDDRKQNWAVLFDSKQIAQEFVSKVERVKIRSSSSVKGNPEEITVPETAEVTSPPGPSRVDESNKSKLMSRIAKMGQPILALSGALVADNSDSDQATQSSTVQELERPKPRKSRPLPKPTTNDHAVNSMIVPAQYNTIPSGMPMNMMQYVPAFSPVGNSAHFDTLLSETRTQNSEIRMHLCRLSDKVDLSLQKSGKNDSEPEIKLSIPAFIEDLRADMVSQFQVLREQSNSQMNKLERVLDWIETKPPVELAEDIRAQEKKKCDQVVQQLKEENNQLSILYESASLKYQQRIDELENQLKVYKLKCVQSENQLSQFQSDSEKRDQQLQQLEKQVAELQKEEKSINQTLHSDLPEQIKTIMNKVYKESLKQFQPEDNYSFRSIKSTLSLVIRDVTLAMLDGEAIEKLPVETQSTESQLTESQLTESQLTESQPAESQPAESQPAESQPAESQPTESQPAESQPTQSQAVESQPNEKQLTETQPIEIQSLETQPLKTQAEKIVVAMEECKDESSKKEMNVIEEKVQPEEIHSAIGDELLMDAPNDESLSHSPKEMKSNQISLMESIQTSLAAAQSHIQDWKPEPPPPPLFEDFNEEDDWLM